MRVHSRTIEANVTTELGRYLFLGLIAGEGMRATGEHPLVVKQLKIP